MNIDNKEDMLFSKIFYYSPTGLILFNQAVEISVANDYIFESFGLKKKAVEGKGFGNVFKCAEVNNTDVICGQGVNCQSCGLRRCINSALFLGKTIDGIDLIHDFILDGEKETKHFSVSAVPLEHNDKTYVLVSFTDITEVKETQEKLETALEKMDAMFNNSMVGLATLNGGRKIINANDQMAIIFGYDSPNDIIGIETKELHVSIDKYNEFEKIYYRRLMLKKKIEVDYQFKRKDGSHIWVTLMGKAIDKKTPADLSKGMLWIVKDISKNKEAEEKLIELATKDSLTKVNNRGHFLQLGLKEINEHVRHGFDLAVLMLDIDYFKKINDAYGHSIGDKALTFFADTCNDNIRSTDIMGRLGGEEFAIILGHTSKEKALDIAQRIRSELERITLKNNKGIPPMTVSIGISMIKSDSNIESLIHGADINLYKAKSSGRNRVVID